MGGAVERIFLYGTLRRGGSRDVILHYEVAEFIAHGRVQGRLYDFGGYPGLRLDRTAGWVIGEIFEVSMASLAELDAWEGIEPDQPRGGEYERVQVTVQRVDGGEETCWCYEVSAQRAIERPLIVTGDWLARG